MGAPFQDARILALASALENAAGTRTRRPALAA
jgi:Asp-tRNA(Asn)/Glu-tRNA(Gln) amidotransferase A subunit family amidase